MNTKKNLINASIAGLFLAAVSTHASQLAVDFGAAYTTENINSAKTVLQSNGDFDFDGVSDDRVSYVAFGSVFTSPNSSKWTTVSGKSNGTIYHGISLAVFNNQSIDPADPLDRIASNNRIQVGNINAGAETYSLAAAFYWEAADFLSNGTGGLVDGVDSMSATVISVGIKANARFMVQAGGQWYLSQASGDGSFSINGGAANWYAFDPTSNAMFWDETAPGATVIGTSLGNITAAGIYAQTDAGYTADTSLFQLEGLQVSVIPESNAYALLLGGVSLAGVVLLRRKR